MSCNCKTYLQAAGAASAEVPTNGDYQLGSETVRIGCGARLNGSGIAIAPGTYSFDGAITVRPSAATETEGTTAQADDVKTCSVALMLDGSPVLGGFASSDPSGTVTLPVSTTVRTATGGTLTLRNTGVGTTELAVAARVKSA